jgi:hypothetical protein
MRRRGATPTGGIEGIGGAPGEIEHADRMIGRRLVDQRLHVRDEVDGRGRIEGLPEKITH